MKFFNRYTFFIILTLGYTLKENYKCDKDLTLRLWTYSSFDDAWNECNANSQCKCIHDYRKYGTYETFTNGTPVTGLTIAGDSNSWVVTAISY